ncbi:AAA family ATPase [Lutibacter sp.]|uniref:AAA family ATPase n=1 Tax=Lutibacter sp. TaxID=1925666 RepID=UPI0027350798|nr:AAA family ATPase [Lutibacter sp.]MDP3314374.1 AAA family ATPase [Lutibacter sp.]
MKDDFNTNDIPEEELVGKTRIDLSKFDIPEVTVTKKTQEPSTKKTESNNDFKKKKVDKIINIDKTTFNAYELYNFSVGEIPKLLNPFLQTVGLASLVGTSDSGKSTFLRQLSIAITLNLKEFSGFKLNCKHNRVIYVSTEDDSSSVSYSIRKQIEYLKKAHSIENLEGLKNLEFIFDSDELYTNLSKKLDKSPVDLIIIDAFADVFSKEINANTQVRNFLNSYDKLAKKHQCLILFLHHIGKRTNQKAPSKDSIIGSQGFEAKMRVVLEIRPNYSNDKQKDLWVLKSNFLDSKYKKQSYILDFNKDFIFNNTGRRGSKAINAKSNNTELVEKVISLNKEGVSYRKIEAELKNTEFQVSKSVIAEIIKKNTD